MGATRDILKSKFKSKSIDISKEIIWLQKTDFEISVVEIKGAEMLKQNWKMCPNSIL